MITLDQWLAFDVSQQLDMWLAVSDAEQERYIAAAHPVAALVLRCTPMLTGETAADRAMIRQALQGGNWSEHGLIIAKLRDDSNRLTEFVERTKYSRIAKLNWAQSLEPVLLEMWPAAQVIATIGRIRSGTKDRWVNAGGHLYGGRMIAMKTSAVWSQFSLFGRPYPPYDYYSHGLDVNDVEYVEAHRLRLI